MNISIVYVNYKTARLILDSIKSVKEKTEDVDYEIIVVDNASGDGSLELIQKQYPEVICVQADENMGFGRANNLGMTYFSRSFPSFIWEFLSILYISPICLSFPRSVYFNKEGKPIPVASIIGADLMVRKSVLLKVGGFSPEFFMNYEETELCNRITRAGFSIYSVPSAQITHLEGRASYIKQSRLYFLYEGQYIYFRKVYGIFGCRLIFAITQLKSYIRLFQFLLLSNKERRSYWRMKLETNREVWHSTKIKHFLI